MGGYYVGSVEMEVIIPPNCFVLATTEESKRYNISNKDHVNVGFPIEQPSERILEGSIIVTIRICYIIL